MDVKVSRKGQITIPVALRRKYGIKEGMKITLVDSGSEIILKVVPKFEDLIGIDAGKVDLKKTIDALDKMRSQDRY